MTQIIGILGGMGPMATADLYKKIIKNTPVQSDQDHFRIIIDSNPKIPSRIRAVLDGAESPLPEMVKSAKLLEKAGADFILIPCHTAHYWLNDLHQSVTIPIFSIIEAAARYVHQHYNHHPANKILLLASEATVKLGLYQKSLGSNRPCLVIPRPNEQKIVSSAIEEVKAGQNKTNLNTQLLNLIIKHYKIRGVSVILGGCTEISLLLPYLNGDVDKIDPTLILAQKAIAKAR